MELCAIIAREEPFKGVWYPTALHLLLLRPAATGCDWEPEASCVSFIGRRRLPSVPQQRTKTNTYATDGCFKKSSAVSQKGMVQR